MEEVAQGRVWTGTSAESRGLVDTLGGFSKAVAIAKQKAGIDEDKQVFHRRKISAVNSLLETEQEGFHLKICELVQLQAGLMTSVGSFGSLSMLCNRSQRLT